MGRFKDFAYELIVNKLFRYFAPDKFYLNFLYKRKYGYSINWKDPQTFNEKLQYLKLYDKNPLYTLCADKYLVRSYVSEIIGDSYLIPLISVYDDPNFINVESLPDKFVLKLNSGAGYNYVCTDKKHFDRDYVVKQFSKWMKEKFYLRYREYHYKNIKKKIVCEKFLENEDGTPLFDYKVFCFNGEPYLIMVMLGEQYHNHRNLYYPDWTRHSGYITEEQDDYEVERPSQLDELLDCCRKLSDGFSEVRVDFYIVDQCIYFGEMTFFSGAGFSIFSDKEFDLEMGKQFDIKR